MKNEQPYPIGTPGNPWGANERARWLSRQVVRRSYEDDVLSRLDGLRDRFDIDQYGSLDYSQGKFALFAVRSRAWRNNAPCVLVTGGVHGYETSGVLGALRFLETQAESYADTFNFIVVPCVSPWGYETINRWNPDAVDPNRSFKKDSPAGEAAALMQYMAEQMSDKNSKVIMHIDLHETTDTDNSEFRPALAARDGITQKNWNIPDGFYLVGDSERPAADFQAAMIKTVEKITHIALADDDGCLIGDPLEQHGVINYDARKYGLCMGMTNARFVTTTEVYPDSLRTNPENCIDAQVAAVTGGLDFIARQ